ncbi:glycosyltransferase [Paraconexibacter sp. AEG42_29]|uniref:Glycosyltransferase n=1 Tax=Paraconexibacter sp. AEG42_29 TaxID=2997339 RepID=A0AAU7B2K6_9ACTN
MIVHQVLSGAGPVDAVTSQARAFRALFGRWGWGGRDVAWHIDPRVAGAIQPLSLLRTDPPGPDDLLLIHYSAYAPRLREILETPQRKVLLSHNVTPARWFWDYEAGIAVQCALGRRQLPEYAEKVDVVAGVSLYNARELGSDRVVPILFDPAKNVPPAPPAPLAALPARDGRPGRPPTLLFVGRMAPHKRQDELIRLVALLRAHRLPDARLVLVGEGMTKNYLAALQQLAEELAPGAVEFRHGLSPAELAQAYADADVFVCLSEHEGFCIPLLEAFHVGTPVVTRPSGGIPEVAAGGALLVDDRDLAVIAELVTLAITDAPLRAELRARGRERLTVYGHDRTAAALRELLEHAAALPREP